MECIYTIGFTKKSAKKFFGLLKENQIELRRKKALLFEMCNNTSVEVVCYQKFLRIAHYPL